LLAALVWHPRLTRRRCCSDQSFTIPKPSYKKQPNGDDSETHVRIFTHLI
jgi:hypothetical protein